MYVVCCCYGRLLSLVLKIGNDRIFVGIIFDCIGDRARRQYRYCHQLSWIMLHYILSVYNGDRVKGKDRVVSLSVVVASYSVSLRRQ